VDVIRVYPFGDYAEVPDLARLLECEVAYFRYATSQHIVPVLWAEHDVEVGFAVAVAEWFGFHKTQSSFFMLAELSIS